MQLIHESSIDWNCALFIVAKAMLIIQNTASFLHHYFYIATKTFIA